MAERDDSSRLMELSNGQLQRIVDTHAYITGDPADEETVTTASEILKRRGEQPVAVSVPDTLSG